MPNPESVVDQTRILEISEEVAREKLVEIFELEGGARPLIAVDLDDVLCQTTQCVAECASSFVIQGAAARFVTHPDRLSRAGHNLRFGTDMQIKEFYCQYMSHFLPHLHGHYAHTHRLRRQTRLGIKYRSYPYEAFRLCRPT
jgi:hypothetical protein